jgi:hypothetical protein
VQPDGTQGSPDASSSVTAVHGSREGDPRSFCYPEVGSILFSYADRWAFPFWAGGRRTALAGTLAVSSNRQEEDALKLYSAALQPNEKAACQQLDISRPGPL